MGTQKVTESRTPLQHLTQTLCLTPQHCAEEQVTFWEDVFPAQRHSLRLFFLFHTFSLITPTLYCSQTGLLVSMLWMFLPLHLTLLFPHLGCIPFSLMLK